MLINLWVRNKRDGHIHQIGTDIYDHLTFLNGQVVYENMQNSATTLNDYEWVEPPDLSKCLAIGSRFQVHIDD